MANHDKRNVIIYAKMLESLGFEIVSTGGTAEILRRNGLNSILVASKFAEANGDHSIVDMVRNGDIDLILNTPPVVPLVATATRFVPPPCRSAAR